MLSLGAAKSLVKRFTAAFTLYGNGTFRKSNFLHSLYKKQMCVTTNCHFFPLKYTPQLISSNPSLANRWFELMVITAEFGEKKICICNIPMNQSGFTLCWLKCYKVNFSLPHSKGYLMMKSPNSCEHIKRCWLFEIIVAILS